MAQKIDINDHKACCANCGSPLSNITDFSFLEKGETGPRFIEERCICKKCQTSFILRYDLFDQKGHIFSRIFVEDINDDNYSWQDSLTPEQKSAVSEHLKTCSECVDQLSQEMLTDAWLKSLISELRLRKL